MSSAAHDFVGIKRDFVMGRVQKFKKDKVRFEEFVATPGNLQLEFPQEWDLRTYSAFKPDINKIRDMIISSPTYDAKLKATAMALWASTNTVYELLARLRQDSTRLIRLKDALPSTQFGFVYFGVLDDKGNKDERHSDTLSDLEIHTDDALFYSVHLAEQLSLIAKDMTKQLGDKQYQAINTNVRRPGNEELIPPATDYPGFSPKT